MVILNFFRPFLHALNSTENRGPLIQTLRNHFDDPCMVRSQENLVDTTKFIRLLRNTIDNHYSGFNEGKSLRTMLSDNKFEDPEEAWLHLYSLVCVELQGAGRNLPIGIRYKLSYTCTKCGTSQLHSDGDTCDPAALPLVALRQATCSSVQDAIKVFFSPSETEAHCCEEGNTLKTQFYECIQAQEGLVFNTTISDEMLEEFTGRSIKVQNRVRLPYAGHNSNKHSVFRLVGYTARCLDRAHHITIVYDNKGQAWTYDDHKKEKGIPRYRIVPQLIFYEREKLEVPAAGMEFWQPQLLDSRQRYESQGTRENASPTAPIADELPRVTSRGRISQPTNHWRPSQNLKPAPSTHSTRSNTASRKSYSQAVQSSPAQSATNSSEADNCEQSPGRTPSDPTVTSPQGPCDTTPPRVTNASTSTSSHKKSVVQTEIHNQLIDLHPANTWVWVLQEKTCPPDIQQGTYLAGRIIRPASHNHVIVQMAHSSQEIKVSNKRVLRALELREERIVFTAPQDSGRTVTLTQVQDFISGKRSQRNGNAHSDESENQLSNDFFEDYSGLVFSDATKSWDSKAIPWILQENCPFTPAKLVSRPFFFPSVMPHDCFNVTPEFPAHPSFGNCFREVGLILQQIAVESTLYQQLFAWIQTLPIILLRAPKACKGSALSKLIAKRCNKFLQGEWEALYTEAVRDEEKSKERMARKQRLEGTRPGISKQCLEQAKVCIKRGNLSKGARLLIGQGTVNDVEAFNELQIKHPQDVPPASFPADYAPPELSEQQEKELERLCSVSNLARVAGAFPAESHPDQFGWRVREYIAPMLHSPGLGELIRDILIAPRLQGILPAKFAECYRGGKLIALSKAPKPGVRPIAIGDAFRRVADKALQPFSKKDLTHFFEQKYSNVKQFASGSMHGADKYIAAVLLALQEDPAPKTTPSSLDKDPMVILQLDLRNAFNALRRQTVFDMITRCFSRTYAKGRLSRANTPKLPATFSVHIPSIQAHYSGDGHLVFVDNAGGARIVTSRTGTQQGCVLGGKLFNIGTFPVVGVTMADHPDVFCPMFSDNFALVGRLSKVFPAADDLQGSLAEIGLLLQPADCAIYIPSYNQQEEPPSLLHSLREQYPSLNQVPWHREGITLLGCAIGRDEYVQQALAQVCENIELRMAQFAAIDDGLMHLQLHKFSVNAMLPYFLRTASPGLTIPYAQRVDKAIMHSLLDFVEVPRADREKESLRTAFEDVRRQLAMPISQGGFGITPNECTATPAFYSGVSHALQFVAGMDFAPIKEYMRSEAFRAHPLIVNYANARADLLQWGAKEPEPPTAQPESSSQAALDQGRPQRESENGKRGKAKNKGQPPVLPSVDSVLGMEQLGEGVCTISRARIPEQKALTRLALRALPHWSPDNMSANGKARIPHLCRQTIKVCASAQQASATACFLQRTGNLADGQCLHHSPMAFIAHTVSLQEPFPKSVWAVWFSQVTGLNAPACLQHKDTAKCEAPQCGKPLDRSGHHRMQCKHTAAFHTAHSLVATAVAEIARESGVQYTDKNVPCHVNRNKVADALCRLSSEKTMALDFTVVHPWSVNGSDGGWNSQALASAARKKWRKHGPAYAVMGMEFAACVVTTYGQLDDDLLLLLHIFAQKRAELVHVNHRPFTPLEALFATFFAQSRARLGAAIARGMALRALGCSLLGASKVFYRYVAPAWLKDQSLTSGVRMDSGHEQWRLALAA